MTTNTNNWKRTAAQRIRRMSVEEAHQALAAIRAAGCTIFQPVVREITGGYNSQAINFHVVRKLAERVGICKRG